MARGLYVYAIGHHRTALPAGLLGLNDSPLTQVPYRDLAAVTSTLGFSELSPSVDCVFHHESVVEAVREVGPALPVRFGTVLAGLEAVQRELDARYDTLESDLARLGDAHEFGLVVLWEPDVSELRTARSVAPDFPISGSGYLQARREAYRRESRQRERALALASDLHAALGPHALEHRTEVLPTARLAVRATYLVKPERAEMLRGAFEAARQRHPELRLLLSGPWPPYSFVTAPPADGVPDVAGI